MNSNNARPGEDKTQAGGQQRVEVVGQEAPGDKGAAPDHGDGGEFAISQVVGGGMHGGWL